jgi:hypothetical protein
VGGSRRAAADALLADTGWPYRYHLESALDTSTLTEPEEKIDTEKDVDAGRGTPVQRADGGDRGHAPRRSALPSSGRR